MKKSARKFMSLIFTLLILFPIVSTRISARASITEKPVNFETLTFPELPEDIKKILVNFPEDINYIYGKEDHYIRIKGDYKPVFPDYAKDGAESMPGKYTSDYTFRHYKEEPMIDFYFDEESAEGWTDNLETYGNYYFFGKYMGMNGNRLEMIFSRSNKELWDKNRDHRLPFPKFHKFVGIDLIHTLSGYKYVNDLQIFGKKMDVVDEVFQKMDGDEKNVGIIDFGGCALVCFFKDNIAGYWFISKNSPIYTVDYSLIEKRFPVSYVVNFEDSQNPSKAPEDILWKSLTGNISAENVQIINANSSQPDKSSKSDEELIRETIKKVFTKIDSAENFSMMRVTAMTGGWVSPSMYYYEKGKGLKKYNKNNVLEETDLKEFEENLKRSLSYNYGPINFMDKMEVIGTSPDNIYIQSVNSLDYSELKSLFPGFEGDKDKKWKIVIDTDFYSERYRIETRELDHSYGSDRVNEFIFEDIGSTSLSEN